MSWALDHAVTLRIRVWNTHRRGEVEEAKKICPQADEAYRALDGFEQQLYLAWYHAGDVVSVVDRAEVVGARR